MSKTTESSNQLIDKIGICASTLCLVHCVLTGVVIAGLPFLNLDFLAHEFIHDILAIVVVTSVLIAVYPHCKKHGHKDIVMIALIGVALVLSGLFTEGNTEIASDVLTSVGSVFLILAHWRNIKVRHGNCTHSPT